MKYLPDELINLIMEFNPDTYVYVKIPNNYAIWNEVAFYKKYDEFIPETHLKQNRYLQAERKNLQKLLEYKNLEKSEKQYDKKTLEAILHVIHIVISKHLYCDNERLNSIANIYMGNIGNIIDKNKNFRNLKNIYKKLNINWHWFSWVREFIIKTFFFCI